MDPRERIIRLESGECVRFNNLISTLPLDELLCMPGILAAAAADTSLTHFPRGEESGGLADGGGPRSRNPAESWAKQLVHTGTTVVGKPPDALPRRMQPCEGRS